MIGSSTTAYGYEKVLASGAKQASALTSFHALGANAASKENADVYKRQLALCAGERTDCCFQLSDKERTSEYCSYI